MNPLTLTATAMIAFMSPAAATADEAPAPAERPIGEGLRYDEEIVTGPDGARRLRFRDAAGNATLIPCETVLEEYERSDAVLNMQRRMTFAYIDCTKD